MRFVFTFYFLFLIFSQAEFSRPEILRVYTDPEIRVSAGGSIPVTLTLIDSRRSTAWLGNSKEEFDFFITTLPRYGRLSAIQQFSRKSNSDQALVVYTHIPGVDFETEDTFTFEARDKSGRRLAGLAKISILQPRLEIKPSEELVFGILTTDEVAIRQIQLKNSSEVTLRGNLAINAPFSSSESFYEILPHSEKLIEIECRTTKPGFYRSKLQLSSFPNTIYYLQATILEPLIFFPEELNLGIQVQKGNSIEKIGKIELYNRSRSPKKVRLHIQAPFQISPEELTIPEHSKKAITLYANPKGEGDFKSKLIVTSEQITASAKIKLKWLQEPQLEIISPLDLGKIEQKKMTQSLLLVNRSRLPWQGHLSIPAPFFVLNTNLIIRAGETQAITLIFEPPFSEKFQEKLTLTEQTSGRLQSFLIKAESFRSSHLAVFATNSTMLKQLPLLQPNLFSPQLPLAGLFYTMTTPEIAMIKWKTSDLSLLYRLYQKQWSWNSEKTKVIEEWHWVEDVGCQAFDKNMVGFRVDRLRPNWRYTFAVYQMNSNAQITATSQPFEIITPQTSSASKSYVWILGCFGVALALVLFSFIKKRQSWG